MRVSAKRLLLSLLIGISATAAAQTRVAADVEVKTVLAGKSTTVRSRVCCSAGGNLIQAFSEPYPYYTVTNAKGEFRLYVPSSNEVVTKRSDEYSSRDDLLQLFLSGRTDDLGLMSYGYKLSSTRTDEDGLVIRTYVPARSGGKGAAKVELVLENYLPIYIGYYDTADRLVSKTYFSHYLQLRDFAFPTRSTAISYTAKKDSTIVRTLYSNIQTDGKDPLFDFTIPADAKAVSR